MIKVAAEGNANKAMRMTAIAHSDFYEGEITQEELDKAGTDARVFARRTDELRPISFWLFVSSVVALLWSGFVGEPLYKFFRDGSVIVLIIATLMQLLIV